MRVHPSRFGGAQIQFTVVMNQFLVNLNDATTGHKLQGISINNIIIQVFPNKKLCALFKHWKYVFLSRVRTLHRLHLLQKLDKDESFKPSEEFTHFVIRAKARMSELVNLGGESTKSKNEHHQDVIQHHKWYQCRTQSLGFRPLEHIPPPPPSPTKYKINK